MSPPLPAWAEEMRRLYRSGSTSQFLIHGNVADLVAAPAEGGGTRFVSLRVFLTEVMLQPFDVVIHYDRGRGIRVRKGGSTSTASSRRSTPTRAPPGRPCPNSGRTSSPPSTSATSCRATRGARWS